jgi:hypothetical protein
VRIFSSIFTIVLISSLILPFTIQAARPPSKESPYISDILQKVLILEKDGKVKEAEAELVELFQSLEKRKFRELHEWLTYMNVLRNIIAFYYRRGEFKEADWYYREYSEELEEDKEKVERHALIVKDIIDIAEGLKEQGRMQQAEDTLLFMTDQIERLFGFDHWLTLNLYKETLKLYIQINNEVKTEEYRLKISPENM